MLSNLKDFITIVQDGLSTNNNLRQTLNEVQKVKNIFKDKPRSTNVSKVNYGAGSELLEHYQEIWVELHNNADNNAKAADKVDKLILEVHKITKNRLQNSMDMANNLSHLPNLTVSVAQCIDSLKSIQTLISSVEEDLVDLEDIIEREKMERWKLDHHYHLSLYKEKKLAGLEEIRHQLSKQNTEKSLELERQQIVQMQSRREAMNEAFQSDVAKYLATGTVPIRPSTPPKITLEQIHLDDDREDLEKFLSEATEC